VTQCSKKALSLFVCSGRTNFNPSDNCVTDKYLVSDHAIEDNNEDCNETIRKSNRLRKPPIMKNEDFFYGKQRPRMQ
jgi:hypothetical protein